MKTKAKGDWGETIAEKYLKKRFWHILSRNFKGSGGEIDIIGYRFGVLVYFEVKTRKDKSYGSAADAVDELKLSKIKNTAYQFLKTYRVGGKIPVFYPLGIEKLMPILKQRIDVIEVYLDNNSKVINHIKDFNGVEL